MYLGLMAHELRARDDVELADKVAGFGCRAVVYRLDLERLAPGGQPDVAALQAVKATLARRGVSIPCAYGYTNLVHPDPERRRQLLERLKAVIRCAPHLGATSVATETGTRNPQSEWSRHPDNRSPETWQLLRAVTAELLEEAERAGVDLAYEGYVENVVDTPARMRQLISELGSPRLKIVMDPNNYFEPPLIPRMREVLAEIFDLLGDRIALAHAKDVRVEGDRCTTPRAGTGVLDYPLFIELLRRFGYQGPLILEHLREEEVPASRDYVLRFL